MRSHHKLTECILGELRSKSAKKAACFSYGSDCAPLPQTPREQGMMTREGTDFPGVRRER